MVAPVPWEKLHYRCTFLRWTSISREEALADLVWWGSVFSERREAPWDY